MMDLDRNSKKMVSTSPKLLRTKSNGGNSIQSPVRLGEFSMSSSSACAAYDKYLRLPELAKLWSSKDFPDWKNESLLKPALQALEITFRFVSIVLSDPRTYVNRREWKRRLESLTTHQVELIAALCEDESNDDSTRGTVPIVDLRTSNGVLARSGSSSAEVWKLPAGATHMVSRTSEASLLPRLATWQKSEDIASKIMFSIECEMRRCPYTLGIGEPNLSGKPNLDYDLVCRPSDLHALKRVKNLDNYENHTLFTTHQILESWIFVSRQLLNRISDRIESHDFDDAASDCWLLERIWKLLSEIEDLHLLVDPNDFLRLKNQLAIKAFSSTEAFCFRSIRLTEIAKLSKELKHKVPAILDVEVDPKGGPRIQEAAMKLYRDHKNEDIGKIHLLQGFQAVESALKKFFFSYRQLIVMVMGSLEANGNRAVVSVESDDSLTRLFSDPTYFPSLDAAKTFLGDFWSHDGIGSEGKNRVKNEVKEI